MQYEVGKMFMYEGRPAIAVTEPVYEHQFLNVFTEHGVRVMRVRVEESPTFAQAVITHKIEEVSDVPVQDQTSVLDKAKRVLVRKGKE